MFLHGLESEAISSVKLTKPVIGKRMLRCVLQEIYFPCEL